MFTGVVKTLNCIPLLVFSEDSINGDRSGQRQEFGGVQRHVKTATALPGLMENFAGIQLRYDFSKDNELSQTLNRSETRHQLFNLVTFREANLAFILQSK